MGVMERAGEECHERPGELGGFKYRVILGVSDRRGLSPLLASIELHLVYVSRESTHFLYLALCLRRSLSSELAVQFVNII